MSKKAKSIAEILEDIAKATEQYENEVTAPFKKKLEKIEKLVNQNKELFMDGIGEEILDIIKS